MGYKSKRNIYLIKFPEDHPAHGLEVKASGASIDALLRLNTAYNAVLADGSDALTPQKAAAIDQLMEIFGRAVISWNVEDENDQPIPATRASSSIRCATDSSPTSRPHSSMSSPVPRRQRRWAQPVANAITLNNSPISASDNNF